MIRLEIEAADAAEFQSLLGGLLQSLTPPQGAAASSPEQAEEATGNHVAAGFAAVRSVPPAPTVAPAEELPAFIGTASAQAAEPFKRRPGRPRKVPEGVTIDGTVDAAPNGAMPATADPSPPIVLEDAITHVEAVKPLLDLPPLKAAYSLDEIRALAIDYVKAMSTPEGGSIPDSQFARKVLGGMLAAFGVEKVGDLPEGERGKLAKLIHHLAPLGRSPVPPEADAYARIVKSF